MSHSIDTRRLPLTDRDMLDVALRQSALEYNCTPAELLAAENTVTVSRAHPLARAYMPLPFACSMVTYGNGIVAQTNGQTAEAVRGYLSRYPAEHAFEAPYIHALDELLAPFGQKVCFMAEYFLPELGRLRELPCDFELRLLYPSDFAGLYTDTWSNALCEKRRELDVLGVGAYDGERLIGLAGCSADCADMYQIGIDVLPAYRRRGVASALTSRLALEILKLGKVPFYCAAWCNVKSVRNAVRCGFRPTWVELSARDVAFVDAMNHPSA